MLPLKWRKVESQKLSQGWVHLWRFRSNYSDFTWEILFVGISSRFFKTSKFHFNCVKKSAGYVSKFANWQKKMPVLSRLSREKQSERLSLPPNPHTCVTKTTPITRTMGKWSDEWWVVSPPDWLHLCWSDCRKKKGTPFRKVQPDGPAFDVCTTPYIAGRCHPDTRECYCLRTYAGLFYSKRGSRRKDEVEKE